MTKVHTTETAPMNKTKALAVLLAILSSSIFGLSAPQIPVFHSKVKLNQYEYEKFLEHSESRLITYKGSFEKHAKLNDIPWTLLAAVAYQESKWNRHAVSPTGVRGLMQITESTAEHIGLTNRRDPHQNIKAGAYYLKYLFDKTPKHLDTKHRWILALVAYNIGWGHLKDSHQLAVNLKKNPYKWRDLKQVLPLLHNEKYYSQLNYGFARGKEAVDFVDKVFSYYEMLNDLYNINSNVAFFVTQQ